jgi:hypothetical protein
MPLLEIRRDESPSWKVINAKNKFSQSPLPAWREIIYFFADGASMTGRTKAVPSRWPDDEPRRRPKDVHLRAARFPA